ncbi:MAG: hypothetical protein M3N33_13125 [Actinomycetota bacterium]|nr:hypothetical protein [Actinomycetota bacterium]
MEDQGRSLVGRYRSDLRSVVGSSATAYGYTLTVWSTGMILSYAYGPPSPPLVFSFFGGAVLAFALVGVLALGGVTVEFGGAPNRVQLWGSFHFISVGLAVAAAWLTSAYVASLPGWPLGAFVATAAYLAVVGAENAAADLGTDP